MVSVSVHSSSGCDPSTYPLPQTGPFKRLQAGTDWFLFAKTRRAAPIDEPTGDNRNLGFDTKTPLDFVEEDVREHLVEGADGLFHYRYCRSAVITGYGELCTPPPPPETLHVPTLLVHAGEFGLVRAEQLEAYATVLGDLIELVEVPGGHMVYWDAWEPTADVVGRFLEDSRPRRRLGGAA